MFRIDNMKGTSKVLNIVNTSRRYAAVVTLALLALPLAVGTTGCGGGGAGGGGTTEAPVSGAPVETPAGNRGDNGQVPGQPTGPFAPNFHSDLEVGRVWEKRQILVYIDTASASAPAAFDRTEAVRLGLSLWGPETNSLFGIAFTDDPNVADVTYTFVTPGTLRQGEIGRARITFRKDDEVIVKAVVRVDETLDRELMAQVSAHEFGHALGMSGHSGEGRDLMFTHSHIPARVTKRDANTLLFNYSEFNTRRQRDEDDSEAGESRAAATRTMDVDCGLTR